MYEIIIQNYIKKLTKQDIINFCNKENVSLTNEELDIFYIFIKKYWREFIKNEPSKIFNELKDKIRASTYDKMISIYNKYKEYKKYI